MSNILSQISGGNKGQQPDPIGSFQQGFGLGQQIQEAPFKQKTIEAKAQDKQLTAANNKLTAIGNLLSNVKDQNSYSMAKQQLAAAGIINPQDIPDQYDPAFVEMHRNSVLNAKTQLDKQFKLAEIEQMKAGGATGTLLNRLQSDPHLMDAYLGKVNANKGIMVQGGQAGMMPGYNQAVGSTEYTKSQQSEAGKTSAAPLPTPIATKQDELLGEIDTHKGISSNLKEFENQINTGALKLDVMGNIANKIKNKLSVSDEESQNFASFQSYLNKLRNDTLSLQKGVQTEGDAMRAWDELISNINDPSVVKQRLAEISKYNDIASSQKSKRLNTLRNEYKKEPLPEEATPPSQFEKPTESEKAAAKLDAKYPEEKIPTGGKINTKMARRVTQQEYIKLPSGAQYLDPMGNVRTKK